MWGLSHCAAIVAVFVWAVLPVLIKSAAFDSNISLFLFVRFVVSTILLGFVLPSVLKKFSSLRPVEWIGFLLINGGIYFLQTLALQSLPASLYIVFFSLTPVLCLFALRIRLHSKAWAWIAVTILACLWFSLSGKENASKFVSFVTILAMAGSMIGWALYSAYIIRFQSAFDDLEISGLSSIFGLLASFPVWAINGFSFSGVNSSNLTGAVMIGIIVPIGYAAYSFSLRRTPVFAVTSQYAEPIIALLIAIVVMAESISIWQAFAAIICIVAATCADREGRKYAN